VYCPPAAPHPILAQALEEAAERERAEQAELQSKIAAMEGKVRRGGG
jgi:hypothetical protein